MSTIAIWQFVFVYDADFNSGSVKGYWTEFGWVRMWKGQILVRLVKIRIKLPTTRTNLYIFYWFWWSEWCQWLLLSKRFYPPQKSIHIHTVFKDCSFVRSICSRSLDGHYTEYYHRIIWLKQIPDTAFGRWSSPVRCKQ